ncbi:hypothetical protein [Flavobacterium selenitireducens]|uniref:hypothetical protein n=1 Tax=Flavobacterium selenitireducens TaxID=2722704 RepID=UPI00168B5109|nr:hypothetical protein [Flavobacterium selenitireducens]MBD3583993.1 hypothetical protein [Flavobacterium selenitireducens]
MRVFKSISGILLLTLAALLSFGTIMGVFNAVSDIMQQPEGSEKRSIPYAIGTLLGFAIFVAIIYFLMKFGLKLLRKKADVKESLDDIGRE